MLNDTGGFIQLWAWCLLEIEGAHNLVPGMQQGSFSARQASYPHPLTIS